MVDPTLPGADLIESGLRDLAGGHESEAALLVLIGGPRLRRLGLAVPDLAPGTSPELRLYERLSITHGDGAHSQYNALIRTLVSFERAAESAGVAHTKNDTNAHARR